MAIERLVTLAIEVGRRDAVWIGAVVSRSSATGGTQYHYECWYGRRRGDVLQGLRSPRPWRSTPTEANTELTRMTLEKENEGYQHIDWTLYRFGLRGQIRELAGDTIVPATMMTGRRNPITLDPATDSPALAPHLYVPSTLRDAQTGVLRCGVNGCTAIRPADIHTQHLTRHPFIRSGSGAWCVDCRQAQFNRLHQPPTIQERSAEFSVAQTAIWRAEGSHPHTFAASDTFISGSGTRLCTVCGLVSGASSHDSIAIERAGRIAWRTQRNSRWQEAGRQSHQFQPNTDGHTYVGQLLCDICGYGENSGSVAHLPSTTPEDSQRWQQARHEQWLDAGQERHDFIPSIFRDMGTAFCTVCGYSELAVDLHTGVVNQSTADRIRYVELQTWTDAQFQAWVAAGRMIHAFVGARYANPLTERGARLCEVCGLLEQSRHKNHGADKPVTPVPYQYEPVIRRRRPEPGF